MVMTTWNDQQTDADHGMIVETVTIKGHNGDPVRAYTARPTGNGPFPAVVLVHHMPGWDEFYRETTRRFAQHGYAAICPNLFSRHGEGSADDVAARARGAGIPDATVVGDLQGARDYVAGQSNSNGKVGIIGSCSGGRQAFIAACSTDSFDAVVECWGGRVVMPPDQLNPNNPVAPIDMTPNLKAPILGLFGNDDQNPSPEQVNMHEEELKKHGKNYEFHRYDGAGHGFFYYDRPAYRQEQAMDAWAKIFDFFGRNLR